MGLDEDARAARHLAALHDVHGLEIEAFVRAPSAVGYRHSAKRVVGGEAGALVFGSYVLGTHEIADMEGCIVDHPRLVAAFAWLRRAACDAGVPPYDEISRRGTLRYVWAKTNGAQTLACLVVACHDDPETIALARTLVAGLDDARARGEPTPLDGLALAEQRSAGNSMQGENLACLWGLADIPAPSLGEHGAQVVLEQAAPRVGPLGFLQPNPVVAGLAHRDLVEITSIVPLALDLYAGSGATTRALRRRLPDVRPCERHPESARHLGVPAMTTEAFLAKVLADGLRPQLVVANPPRSGLGAAVCNQLRELAVPELRVMSCSPSSFVRDLAALSAEGPHGHYSLIRVRAYDTLPHTAHVELVGVLRWCAPAALPPAHA